jgi:hypothetical protein
MSTQVLLAEFVSLNAVDLSSRAKSSTIALNAAEVDFTSFGSAGWSEGKPGIRSGTLSVEFYGDEASSLVQQTLWPLFTAGTVFAFDLRGSNAARSATNPSYTGSCFITALPPLAGGVGEGQMVSMTFKITGAVTRAIA